MLLYFFPNECPGLCQPRPGHSLGENKVAQNEKNDVVGFLNPKIWKILKPITKSFHQA